MILSLPPRIAGLQRAALQELSGQYQHLIKIVNVLAKRLFNSLRRWAELPLIYPGLILRNFLSFQTTAGSEGCCIAIGVLTRVASEVNSGSGESSNKKRVAKINCWPATHLS